MVNFTSNTSQMNREILTFTNKISKHLSKPDKKFSADMTYGILASESCLLTDIVDHLHENTKKVNSVERLTRHLNNGTSSRDGSKSTASKTVYVKGYHVTEACVLTKNNHPVSIFSEIHSSKEKHFTSINEQI